MESLGEREMFMGLLPCKLGLVRVRVGVRVWIRRNGS